MQYSIITLSTLLSTALAAPALSARQSAGWTLRSFTRSCPDANSCTSSFTIDQGNGALQPCTITNGRSDAYEANANSWYGITCQETPDFYASWGWDYPGNFAVVTVVNTPTHQGAFFGYSDPNGSTSYADNGPQPVQQL